MVKTNSPILVNGRRFLRAAMGQVRRWRLAAGASESTIVLTKNSIRVVGVEVDL